MRTIEYFDNLELVQFLENTSVQFILLSFAVYRLPSTGLLLHVCYYMSVIYLYYLMLSIS